VSLAAELGLEPAWHKAFAEVERMVGGRVVAAVRQERWRPAWFLDVDCGGEIRKVYFRGDRGVGAIAFYTLDYEFRVMQVLEAQGIPVPHLYGYCEDPMGIVMAVVDGRENLGTEADPELRRSTLEHYMELLLEMHRIDVAAFEAVGLRCPKTPEEIGLADLDIWEKGFRAQKQTPEPLIEFSLAWLRANVPTHRSQVSFCTGDSGQFLFDKGRVTAVVDLELAFLGDPLADLGALRSRDISEPLGDLTHGLNHYAKLSGEPIDVPVMNYHAVRFALDTPLAVAPLVAAAPAGLNYVQYLGWNLVYGRLPIEGIAEIEGVRLERPKLPTAEAGHQSTPHDVLVRMLESECGKSYEVDTALRVAQYVREIDRHGARVEAEDLEEASALVGRSLGSWHEADTALEELVATGWQERRAELIRYFYRRTLRQEFLLRPAMRELQDIEFQKIRL
jgi:hypothetical protein